MVNLIENGSFVGHAKGWYPDATEPTSSGGYDGIGALLMESLSPPERSILQYRPRGRLIALNGLETYDLVAHGRGHASNTMNWDVLWYDDAYGSNDIAEHFTSEVFLDPDTPVEVAFRDQTVPVGATHALLFLKFRPVVGGIALVDDVYFGAPGGDTPPYPAADLTLAERIENGDFETSLSGWLQIQSYEELTRETVAPITGSGSLKVVTGGFNPGEGVQYPGLGQGTLVLPGESVRLSFMAKGDGTIKADMDWVRNSRQTVWTGTLTAEPQLIAVNVSVPPDEGGVQLEIKTTTTQDVTFWIDDVSLDTNTAFSGDALCQ